MRGDIIERCLIFLVKLPEIRVPDNFHSIVISVIEWANETLISLICLIVDKFRVACSPVQVIVIDVVRRRGKGRGMDRETKNLKILNSNVS